MSVHLWPKLLSTNKWPKNTVIYTNVCKYHTIYQSFDYINYRKRHLLLMAYNCRHFCHTKDSKQLSPIKQMTATDKRPIVRDDIPVIKDWRRAKPRNPFVAIVLKKPFELIEWYEKTPIDRRRNIYISSMLKYLIYPTIIVNVFLINYIFFKTDENPITGRSTAYNLPKEMMSEIEDDIFKEMFINITTTLQLSAPATDPIVKRCDQVVDRLVEANKDLPVIGDGHWTAIVVNDDKLCDVMALKDSSSLFISRRLVNMCDTDDELAYVMSHQLSHIMLDHTREPMTFTSVFSIPVVTLFPMFWMILSDKTLRFDIFAKIDTFLLNLLKQSVRKYIYFSSYNDLLEEEADRSAMQMMTRSCFDVRKCRQFCQKYEQFDKTDVQSKMFGTFKLTLNQTTIDDLKVETFFIKHAINENKLLYLQQYTQPFIDLRKDCNCEPLI